MSQLILFATLAEAESSLKATSATPLSSAHYQFSGGSIVISGLGAYAALRAVYTHAPLHTEILHLGLAASLHDLPLFSLHRIQTVDKYTHLPPDIDPLSRQMSQLPPLPLQTSGKRLLTLDFPLHDLSLRAQLSPDWDLIDMEGYAIAHAAHSLNLPLTIWKIVSDFASPEGRSLIHTHMREYSARLASLIS